MKFLIAITVILLVNVSFGQDLEHQKSAIDAEVHRISQQVKTNTVNFTATVMKNINHYISYQYIESSKGYLKINREFSHKNDTIQQTFYLKDGCLIYATEKIITYFTDKGKTDSIAWRGDFYFSKEKLIDHVTLGHGKSEIDTWNPEQDILTAFGESKRDIVKYKKKKNGS